MPTTTTKDGRLPQRWEDFRKEEARSQDELLGQRRDDRLAEVQKEVANTLQYPIRAEDDEFEADTSRATSPGTSLTVADKEVDVLGEKEKTIRQLEDKLNEAKKREKDLRSELKAAEQRLTEAILRGSNKERDEARQDQARVEDYLKEVIEDRDSLREELARTEQELYLVKRSNEALKRQTSQIDEHDQGGEREVQSPKQDNKGIRKGGGKLGKQDRNKPGGKGGSMYVVHHKKAGQKPMARSNLREICEAPLCLR